MVDRVAASYGPIEPEREITSPKVMAWCKGCDRVWPDRCMEFVDEDGDGAGETYRCALCRGLVTDDDLKTAAGDMEIAVQQGINAADADPGRGLIRHADGSVHVRRGPEDDGVGMRKWDRREWEAW
jgi:hypothetical protein